MNSEIIPASEEKASVPAVIPEPLTYSVEETALVLGISPPTVYRLVARRVLRPLPGLRHKRISKRQVHAYVNGGLSLG